MLNLKQRECDLPKTELNMIQLTYTLSVFLPLLTVEDIHVSVYYRVNVTTYPWKAGRMKQRKRSNLNSHRMAKHMKNQENIDSQYKWNAVQIWLPGHMQYECSYQLSGSSGTRDSAEMHLVSTCNSFKTVQDEWKGQKQHQH